VNLRKDHYRTLSPPRRRNPGAGGRSISDLSRIVLVLSAGTSCAWSAVPQPGVALPCFGVPVWVATGVSSPSGPRWRLELRLAGLATTGSMSSFRSRPGVSGGYLSSSVLFVLTRRVRPRWFKERRSVAPPSRTVAFSSFRFEFFLIALKLRFSSLKKARAREWKRLQLWAVDHSAHASMKSAASCVN